jgi:amidase
VKLNRPKGKITRPAPERIHDIAEKLYIHPSEQELVDLTELADGLLAQFDRLDELDEPSLPGEFPIRESVRRPTKEEDPYNIFITKCLVRGSGSGPLKGKTVGVKDNVSLRGIPMTNGSRTGLGYIPDIDATVVTRLLRAGADIVGKLNMDDMSFAGTSESSFFGSVRNPRNPDFSPGGSSSGSGAAVANGDVDIAIAADQAGSARCPAAWSGVTSIKSTHGLVPSFGLTYMDHTIDYVCPVTRTVRELAEVLEVIAGEDENDPQWVRGPVRIDSYSRYLDPSMRGLRVGVIKESMEWPTSEPEVNEAVRTALASMSEEGAEVKEISVPIFKDGTSIWAGILIPGFAATVASNGEGTGHGGHYNTHWNHFFGKARKTMSSEFPPLVKLALIVAEYLREDYFGVYYSKAQNLRRVLRAEINRLLEKFDVLALPTTPMKPTRLRDSITFKEMTGTGTFLINNTCPFNVTGHPAISIPCAIRSGVPIGLQFVSRHFDEGTLFHAGYAFEQSFDWKAL